MLTSLMRYVRVTAAKSLRYIGTLFFSEQELSGNSNRTKVGLGRVVTNKSYWVANQRNDFAELSQRVGTGKLSLRQLKTCLSELASLIGPKLGSPAVMVSELATLKLNVKHADYLPIIETLEQDIFAALFHDPQTAYANLLADINLLLDTDLVFINSVEGRQWLNFYQPFLPLRAYDQALARISNHALVKSIEITRAGNLTAPKQAKIRALIGAFDSWRCKQRKVARLPISHAIIEKLRIIQTRRTKTRKANANQGAEGSSRSGFLSLPIKLIKKPLQLLRSHPLIGFTVVMTARLATVFATDARWTSPFSEAPEVSADFKARDLELQVNSVDHQIIVQDVSDVFHHRRTQESDPHCQSEIRLPESSNSWLLTIGQANFDDEGYGVAIGQDESVAVVGVSRSFSTVGWDILVAKFTDQGDFLWGKTLGGSGDESASDIAVKSDGSVVVVGGTDSTGAGSGDVLIAQFSPTGDLDWVKVVGGTEQDLGLSVSLKPDDSMLIAARTESFGAGIIDVLLVALTENADLEWAKVVGGIGVDSLSSATISPDGRIRFVGVTTSFHVASVDVLVAQFDVNGNFEWASTLDGGHDDYGYGIAVKSDGSVAIAGETNSINPDNYDAFVAQYHSSGEFEWAVAIGGDHREVFASLALNDDRLIATGYTLSYGSGDREVLVAQVDAFGGVEWVKVLGGRGADSAHSIIVTDQGALVCVGHTQSFGVSGGSDDIFLWHLEDETASMILPNTFNFERIDPPLTNLTNSMAGRLIVPTIETVTPQLSPWLTSSLYTIGQADVVHVSTNVRRSAWHTPQSMFTMFDWAYALPDIAYSYLNSQPIMQVEVEGVDWLHYESISKTLYGTTFSVPDDELVVRIFPENVFVPGVGLFSFSEIQLSLCVVESSQIDEVRFATIGGPSQDRSYSITIGDDAATVLVGETLSFGAGQADVLVVKHNETGHLLWAKTLGGVGIDIGVGIATKPDGSLVIAGQTSSFGAGELDVLVAQLSQDGTLEWAKSFGGAQTETGHSVAAFPDGSFVIVGDTTSFGAGLADTLVMKISNSGVFEWARTFGGTGSDFFRTVLVSQDNAIVAAGMSDSYGVGSVELLIAKITATGELVWATGLGGAGQEFAFGLAATPEGDIILSGATISFGAGSMDACIVKVDTDGNLVWAFALGGDGLESANGVAVKADGTIVIAGQGVTASSGNFDVLVAEFSQDGDLEDVWNIGDTAAESAANIVTYPDGSCALVGDTQSFNAQDFDVFYMKIDQHSSLAFPGHESVQHPITSLLTVNRVDFSITNASVSLVLSDMLGLQSSDSPLLAEDIVSPIVGDIRYLISNKIQAVAEQPFNQTYVLDMKTLVGSSVTILRVTQQNSAFLPDWLAYNSVTQVLSGRPTGAVRGFYEISIGLQLSGRNQEVRFLINVTNTAPTIRENTVLNTTVGRFVLPLSSYFEDAEGDPIGPYAIAPTNGQLSPTIGTIDTFSGRLFGTTLSGDQGVYVFNVTAQDPYAAGWGLITVNVVNLPPAAQFNFDDAQVTVGGVLSYNFPINAFGDPDGDALSYRFEGPGFIEFTVSSRTLSGSPMLGDRGVHLAYVLASDAYGGTSNATIHIVVNAHPEPQMSLVLTTSMVGFSYTYTLPDGFYTDPDGDALNYQLVEDVQHIKPTWLHFDPVNNSFFGTPNSNSHLARPILLSVTDGRGGQSFTSIDLITPNSPPFANEAVPPLVLPTESPGSYIVPFAALVDQDQDDLIFSLQLISGKAHNWLFFAARILTYFPRSGDQGEYVFDLVARDLYGGQASTPFIIRVPNRFPQSMYDMPPPIAASASSNWAYTIELENFVDPDLDVLSYSAEQVDGGVLPNWISFNPSRRTFSGRPSGSDRGELSVRVWVDDGFGGVAEGFFNLTVLNSLPQPIERLIDHQINVNDEPVAFTVTRFYDADGDRVSYSARVRDGSDLPGWITFDPLNRRFSIQPRDASVGDYLISVLAADGSGDFQEEVFNLAVQPAPVVEQGSSSIRENFQVALPFVIAGVLLGTVSATLVWRTRRIAVTDRKIKRWALRHAPSTPILSEPIEFSTLSSKLTHIKEQLCEGAELSVVERELIQFGQQLKSYYRQSGKKLVLMTRLLNLEIVENLIQFVSVNILELQEDHTIDSDTVDAARILHFFLGFVLAEHTGRNHLLSRKIKAQYFEPLDELIARLPTRKREDVKILHELESSREAVVCLTDTNTLGLLCKTSFSHLLSPGALFSDLKGLVFDMPSSWYITLLEMSQSAGDAIVQMSALNKLQAIAARESDWRFRYGMIQVLLNIITGTQDESIRTQAIEGGTRFRRLKYLGFKHLLSAGQSRLCFWRNTWVSRQAKWALNEVADQLTLPAKLHLKDYILRKPAGTHRRSRRVSLIATPLESRAFTRSSAASAPHSSAGAGWNSNPMLASRPPGGRARIQSWMPGQGRRAVNRPLSVRPGPTIPEDAEAKEANMS